MKIRFVLPVFILSFLIRWLFVVYGAPIFYGSSIHTNGDTQSYVMSFVNLMETGHYTHDPRVPEASFGRLPGYPFFWGIHYIVFGAVNVYKAVAISQAVLDSLAAVLLFWIVAYWLKNSWVALWVSLVYAFYPFTIVWVTITGTETLAGFLTMCLIYWLVVKDHSLRNLLMISVLLAALFYTREYLGVFLPLTGLYFLHKYGFRPAVKKMIVVASVFFIFYLPWPVRNYVNHDRVVLVKPVNAGYLHYSDDVSAFRSWLFTWHPSDWQPYFDMIVYSDDPVEFPEWVFADEYEKKKLDRLITLSRQCGKGFHAWRTNEFMKENDCNAEIKSGFVELRKSFIKRNPVVYYLIAPSKNIFKSFFNIDIQSQKDQPKTVYAAFVALNIYRGVLLLLAFWGGLVFFIRNRSSEALFLLLFAFFMIWLTSFYFRQVEMRYLLQVEIALFPLLGVFFHPLLWRNTDNRTKLQIGSAKE